MEKCGRGLHSAVDDEWLVEGGEEGVGRVGGEEGVGEWQVTEKARIIILKKKPTEWVLTYVSHKYNFALNRINEN